jgi:D-alanine--poly(phosphoribitol) ligase subunit 1
MYVPENLFCICIWKQNVWRVIGNKLPPVYVAGHCSVENSMQHIQKLQKTNCQSLAEGLLQSGAKFADRPALWCRNQLLTYAQMFGAAKMLAGTMAERFEIGSGSRVAILSDRTPMAYTAIIGALLGGAAYVPLNPRFPIERNRTMIQSSGASVLICSERYRERLPDLLQSVSPIPAVLLPETERFSGGDRELAKNEINISLPENYVAGSELDEDAYILFTSGSTGVPKAVPIKNRNVLRYLRSVSELSEVGPYDRNIQLVDLTFDLSVHDMFMTWLNGACLYSVPENGSLLSVRFVQENELTCWLSVPSTAALLQQSGELMENSMPSLRKTFFCGEALPSRVAETWAAAAPNSSIVNIYGPTEATVAFSAFKCVDWSKLPPVVPLGFPLPEQEMGLFSPEGHRLRSGAGEICLSGSQVMSGYLNAPDLTAARIFESEGKRWYRTGDLGKYDDSLGYLYAGRIDRQVKIRGFRAELQEIETVVRGASGSDLVAVLPWPTTSDGMALGCVSFVAGARWSAEQIIAACAKSLPDYMVPGEIVFIDSIPTNANGKTDYGVLQERLVQGKPKGGGA